MTTQLAGCNAGKLLPTSSREHKMINQIAGRVISAVRQQKGGGFQKHVERFNWEVVVVDDHVPNAFVLPGGKIIVHTGKSYACDQPGCMSVPLSVWVWQSLPEI